MDRLIGFGFITIVALGLILGGLHGTFQLSSEIAKCQGATSSYATTSGGYQTNGTTNTTSCPAGDAGTGYMVLIVFGIFIEILGIIAWRAD